MMAAGRLTSGLLIGGVIATVAGCSTVPYTGRRQLILLSSRAELQLGAQAYAKTLAKERTSRDARLNEVLQRVGRRIAAVSGRDDFAWEFTLVESPTRNAYCLPGGKVAVYTGIVPLMKNEAGMAAVLGHEVAHAIARHGAERASQNVAAGVLEKLVERGVKDSSPRTQKHVMAAFGVGAAVGVLLPYSRTHELEADELGLTFAARAGYDPREAIRFWERMNAATGREPLEFLSTHPHSDRRLEQLEELMPAALAEYERAKAGYGLGESL